MIKVSSKCVKNGYVWKIDSKLAGHQRLLWTFCCDGNIDMANYMLRLPEISDPETDDGTTGFAMALARDDFKLAAELLKTTNKPESEKQRDIRLASDALLEMNRESEMARVLSEAIAKYDVPLLEQTVRRQPTMSKE